MRRMSIAESWEILGMVAEGSRDAVNIANDAIGTVAVGHEYRGLFSTQSRLQTLRWAAAQFS